VHRKGATRAYSPGHPQTPLAYRAVGQPVLIPGDMGRYSYVLVGTERVAEEMPEAYKDVAEVVRVAHEVGISTRVAQLRPLGVIKG